MEEDLPTPEDVSKDIELEDEDSVNDISDHDITSGPSTWKAESNNTLCSKFSKAMFKGTGKWITLIICISIVTLVVLLIVLLSPSGERREEEIKYPLPSERNVGPVDYIQSLPYLPYPVSRPYEDSLKSLCDATIWQEGLYLNCTNVLALSGKPPGTANPQGTFNVKNAMQTCVRWAIDAGMGFIIPRLAVRSRTNLEYFDEWADYSFLFDEDHLRNTLSKECPQLKVYDYKHQIDTTIKAPRKNFQYYANGWYRYHAMQIVNQSGEEFGEKKTLVIWENEPLFSWEFYKDGYNVHQELYNAIKFNPRFIDIGKKVIRLLPSDYIGIHIRAERDAEGFLGILNYNTQVQGFLKTYKESYSHIKTIYVATGDSKIDDKFQSDMSDLGSSVVTKWTLASKDQALLDELNNLRFDQIGIVDYEVLRTSAYFFGMSLSSYTFGIGYERGSGNITECKCHITGAIPSIFTCCF